MAGANWNLPTTSSNYANVINTEIPVRDVDCITFLDDSGTPRTPTNLPTGAKRYNDANRRFEIWNGTSWGELSATWNLSADKLGTFAAADYPRRNNAESITSAWTFSNATINGGSWNGGTIAVNKGGTGQTTYTNGQLLIGNTTGGTLAKATLTEGNGIDITNAAGSITIAAETTSASNQGVIELATQAEVDAGADTTRAVTPSTLNNWDGYEAKAKTINTQTGTNYQLVLSDARKIVQMNNGAANTVTVPDNATVQFPIGTVIDICQIGAGQTSLVAGGSTVFNAPESLNFAARYAVVSIYKRGANTWVVFGYVEPS